jgi:uncharacterized protein YndB with AHSA1/START domain
MLQWIVIAVALAIAAIFLLAAMKPDTFRVDRSTMIDAPPEKIFPLLNDFREWPAWSPWEKKDPAMKRTHSGAASGKGAAYAWEGNKDVGQGSMEIVESAPPSKLTIRLDFMKPFEARNIVDFTLTPEAGGTRLTWSMHGPANFMSKVMQVFMNMDRMVGNDFEAGLANLKAVAER